MPFARSLCLLLALSPSATVWAQASNDALAVDPKNEDWGDDDEAGFGHPLVESNPATNMEPDRDEGWGDGDDVGFGPAILPATGAPREDDSVAALSGDEALESAPGSLSATGRLRHRSALWTERLGSRPLAKARTTLDAELRYKKRLQAFGTMFNLRIVAGGRGEYDLAYAIKRSEFDAGTLDAYEGQLVGGETFLSVGQGPLELTLGRQIVAFGRGDMLSPLDIVNPRDLREPGLSELEDMRMAVVASRLGLYAGYHRFEVLVVHEAYFGLRPAPQSPFSSLRTQLANPSLGLPEWAWPERYEDNVGRFSVEGQQPYLRYGYAGPGADVGLYAGSTLDPQGLPVFPSPDLSAEQLLTTYVAPALSGQGIALQLSHPRYWALGADAALPVGDFIIKGEIGADLNRTLGPIPVASTGDDSSFPEFRYAKRHQLNWMLGVTYSIADGALTLESAGRKTFNEPTGLLRPSIPDVALLYRQDFLRQRLHVTFAAMAFGLLDNYQGLLARLECRYDLDDGVALGLGYVTYQPGGDPESFSVLSGFDRNDRIFASLRWDFLLN